MGCNDDNKLISFDFTQNRVTITDYVGDDVMIRVRYPMNGDMYDMTGSLATLYIGPDEWTAETGDFGTHNIQWHLDSGATEQLGDGRHNGFVTIEDSLGKIDTKFQLVLRLKTR